MTDKVLSGTHPKKATVFVGRRKSGTKRDVHTTLWISKHLDCELTHFAAIYRTSKADLIRRCVGSGLTILRRKENGNVSK